LREERNIRVFGNRVLRIFGSKRDEITGTDRTTQWGENDPHSSPNIVGVIKSKMRRVGHVARMEERRGVYRGLVGKPEGKRTFGRPMRRLEDNIKTDLQKVRCEGMD
jgi:hypothetical protein